MSVPYSSPTEPDRVTLDQLADLGRHTLRLLASRRGRRGPALQLDSGVPIAITARRTATAPPTAAGTTPVRVEVRATRASSLAVWIDGARIRPLRDPVAPVVPVTAGRSGARRRQLSAAYGASLAAGHHLLVVEARRGRRAVGYRAAVIQIGPPR